MTSKRATASCLGLVLTLFALLAQGCSENRLPPPADEDRASTALRTALDAWKNGQTPESLREATPAIYFTDFSWQGGRRLVAYELHAGAERFGQSLRCSVTLQLEDAAGNPTRKKAVYNIDTDPAVVIVPADM